MFVKIVFLNQTRKLKLKTTFKSSSSHRQFGLLFNFGGVVGWVGVSNALIKSLLYYFGGGCSSTAVFEAFACLWNLIRRVVVGDT